MATRIEQIWQELLDEAESSPLGGDDLSLRRLGADRRFDVYGGIDGARHAIFAVSVRERPRKIAIDASAFDHTRSRRADGSWLLILRLTRPGLEQVFGRLCQDLADAAEAVSTEEELVELFAARLEMWERLFMGADDALLRPHQIRGLIGELSVLARLLASGTRPMREVIDAWVGPQGQDQDFRLSDVAIEVKAVSPNWRSLSISSLRQLDSSLPLRLVAVTLSGSAPGRPGALSLNAAVQALETLLGADARALAILGERLLAAGYVETQRYDEDWFVVTEITAYDVAEAFPRLVPSMVPIGVVSATYELARDRVAEFELDELPQ